MKKSIALISIVAFFVIIFANVVIGSAPNSGDGLSDSSGLDEKGAPNSGDGIPEGSGWDDKGNTNDEKGAPNSGDGIPDGSGY